MKAKSLPTFIVFPLLFSAAVALVFAVSEVWNTSAANLGIYPRTFDGLKGILFSPFIHGDAKHLLSNLAALPVLLCLLSMLNPKRYFKIFSLLYILTGFAVWIAARPSYHIGASGIIYALASYIFFAGIVSNQKGSAAVSLLVVMIYGGMVWGVLPADPHVSWESHLAGGIAGFVCAFIFATKTEKADTKHLLNNSVPLFDTQMHITDSSFTSIKYEYKN